MTARPLYIVLATKLRTPNYRCFLTAAMHCSFAYNVAFTKAVPPSTNLYYYLSLGVVRHAKDLAAPFPFTRLFCL